MKKLLNRNFVLLWQGQLVSKTGTFLFEIALVLWIKNHTNSAGLMSLILIASTIPAILLAPIGGTFSDIYSRKNIIILSDIISGLLIIVTTLILSSNSLSIFIKLTALFILSLGLGVCTAFFQPAVSAVIPQLSPAKKLNAANSLFQATSQLSMIIGQGIGGLLFVKLGAILLFFVNGASFIFSGFSELFIKIPKTNHQSKINWKKSPSQFVSNMQSGFKYCRSQQGLLYLLTIIGIYHFFLAPLPVLLPFWISDTLGLGQEWLGYLMASFAIGILTGFTLAGVLDFSTLPITRLISLLFLSSSVLFIILGISGSFISSAICLASLGTIIGVVVVVHITFLQQKAHPEFHGRVFGILNTVTNASVPIGLGFYGLLLDLLINSALQVDPVRLIFISNGIAIFIIILVMLIKVNLDFVFAPTPQE